MSFVSRSLHAPLNLENRNDSDDFKAALLQPRVLFSLSVLASLSLASFETESVKGRQQSMSSSVRSSQHRHGDRTHDRRKFLQATFFYALLNCSGNQMGLWMIY